MFVACLTIGFATNSLAAEGYGGQARALQRFGAGASALGFGNAVVSLANDPVTFLVNPAGAGFMVAGSLTGATSLLPHGRTVNVIGFGRRLPPQAGMGFMWINSEVSGVEGYDDDGNATGALTNGENTLVFTFGTRFEWVAFGVNAKWYRHALDQQTSSGWAADLGAMLQVTPDLHIGAAVHDLGGTLRWTTSGNQGQIIVDDEFPTTLTVGASYLVQTGRVTIAADYELIEREGSYANLGMSWQTTRHFRLLAGYRWLGLSSSTSHEGTPTFGLEFDTVFGDAILYLNYAAQSDPFGLVHSIGLRMAMM